MHKSLPLTCLWPQEVLRSNIVGIDTLVSLLDGSRVPYVFLDNGASTPPFRHVVDVLTEFMPFYSGVHRGTGFKSVLATKVYDEAHGMAGGFVKANLETNTVVIGKNTTEMINKLANRCAWQPGDVVITTLMEHHSNDLPWRKYAKVIHVPVDDLGYPDVGFMKDAFRRHAGHVRFLAVTGASNITGIVNPIHEFAALAHEHGAHIFVDAAQLAPHRRIDVLPDDDPGHIDFIAYSAHKMYAPFGAGVLIGPISWFAQGDPDMVGGGVVDIVAEDYVAFSGPPAKEEAGSPNVPGAVALAAAIHMLESTGMENIEQHEHELIAYAIGRMKEIPGVKIFGPTEPEQLKDKVGVISFEVEGMPHSLVAAILSAEGGIGVRNGCFCAHPYVKRLLKVDEEEERIVTMEILSGDRTRLPGLVRASFGCYNNAEDVDRFADMLQRIVNKDYSDKYVLDTKSGSYWPEAFEFNFASCFPHFQFRHRTFTENYDDAS